MSNIADLPTCSCLFAITVAITCGCSSSDPAPASGEGPRGPGFSDSAIADLRAKNVDKYVGKASLADHSTNAEGDVVYNFDPSQGPICYLGDQYHVVVRDAQSDNLIIFLQGGGACWSTLCQATTTAGTTIPGLGILGRDASKNPVGDWNIVYAPYCDGSVFAGDNDMTGPAGQEWHFHGLANLTAAIDVAKSVFPNPKRILLAGTSAGGYGTLTGAGVTRLLYPHTQLDVFNDAGLGLSNPQNPVMLATVKNDWKFDQFVPDSCTACQDGPLTAIIGWGLEADPTLRVAGFSSYGDSVIGGVFLGLQPNDFKSLLLAETDKVHAKFPDRFERFFIAGTQHTVLMSLPSNPVLYDTPVDGVSVQEWTGKMLAGDADWVDRMQDAADGG
jgi:hypothetical protein